MEVRKARDNQHLARLSLSCIILIGLFTRTDDCADNSTFMHTSFRSA